MVKKNKRQRDIKSKLIAAICMLLVSSIMMVSSTYAWFTLSTAPEVTGITTSVGSNGNLEIALLPVSGSTGEITSAAGDSVKAWIDKNVTWGNLVNVSDAASYGMDKITLYPAELNQAVVGNDMQLAAAMLKTPVYGADGRVSALTPNTVTGIYNPTSGSFMPDQEGSASYGVRAVGTASGMTDRQLSYRNARSAANTATAQAKTLASQSLNGNGSALANIAIKYGMNGEAATFNAADVASLREIIDDLNDEGGVLEQIETAYLQYILAYAASSETGTEDTAWSAVKGLVEADGATLSSVMAAIGEHVTLPETLTDTIGNFNTTVANVAAADSALADLEAEGADATFTWAEIRGPMDYLAKPSAMKINGFTTSEVKENLGALVSSITSQGGLKVIMETGAGVYADIADQCGNYTASINIESVEYNGVTLNNMAARMETSTTLSVTYLSAIGTAVEAAGAPASGATGSMPISDMYGYIIDMAFRTNAADSSLLLQTTPVDRIYSSNENGVSDGEVTTMGGGSTMTFAATTTDFTNEQVKRLMGAIRIVFFDPTNSNTVLATAKLDVTNAQVTADGIVASIYLYDAENDSLITNQADAAITPLTQGVAQVVSVLVYLDGNNVTNASVAATAATSMTGSMNLQFASSATLVPMDYTDLMEQGNAAAGGETVDQEG